MSEIETLSGQYASIQWRVDRIQAHLDGLAALLDSEAAAKRRLGERIRELEADLEAAKRLAVRE